jgi:hypothetical protein
VLPPAEVSQTPYFLRHIWAFDRGTVTGDDRKRSEYCGQGRQFEAELRAVSHLTEFLGGLGLTVRVAALAPVNYREWRS